MSPRAIPVSYSHLSPLCPCFFSRAHDPSYVSLIESMARRMLEGPPTSPVPFTPLVQRSHGADPSMLKDGATSDTRFSAGTHAAARRAAGAVLHAVEQVSFTDCRPGSSSPCTATELLSPSTHIPAIGRC
eukprot:scaffold303722_cov28-Tisochrysis_lutea.AAC.4